MIQPPLPWPIAETTRDLAALVSLARATTCSVGSLAPIAWPVRAQVLTWVLAVGDVDAWTAWTVACSGWHQALAAGGMTQQTVDKYALESRKLINFATAEGSSGIGGVAEAVPDWLFSGVWRSGRGVLDASVGTQHLRRAVVRELFMQWRVAGLTTLNPTLDLQLAEREGGRLTRPLTDAEIEVVQAIADLMVGTRTPVTFALACCGAGTGEVGLVAVADVDLDEWTVALPGTNRTAARILRIASQWERDTIAARIQSLPQVLPGMEFDEWAASTRLAYSSRAGVAGIQSSICMTLGDLLRKANVVSDDVRPSSIQGWAAAQVFADTGDIAEVARFLGVPRLDLAAAVIGWDWTTAPSNHGSTDGPGVVR